MDASAPYLQWGFLQISLSNLVLIGVMLLIFLLALVVPFPGHGNGPHNQGDAR